MKLQELSTKGKMIVVSDFDDVVNNTSSQWFKMKGLFDYKDVWHRKDWNIFIDPRFGCLPYISGDCYDKMEINELGEFLIKKAQNDEIALFITSSGYIDTDDSKQRMFDRVFPKCISTHIVPHGESKGVYIRKVLKLDVIHMFIDDKLQNHKDVMDAGIRCEALVAPLAPFTVDHNLRSSSQGLVKHYIPTDFDTNHFKHLFW